MTETGWWRYRDKQVDIDRIKIQVETKREIWEREENPFVLTYIINITVYISYIYNSEDYGCTDRSATWQLGTDFLNFPGSTTGRYGTDSPLTRLHVSLQHQQSGGEHSNKHVVSVELLWLKKESRGFVIYVRPKKVVKVATIKSFNTTKLIRHRISNIWFQKPDAAFVHKEKAMLFLITQWLLKKYTFLDFLTCWNSCRLFRLVSFRLIFCI